MLSQNGGNYEYLPLQTSPEREELQCGLKSSQLIDVQGRWFLGGTFMMMESNMKRNERKELDWFEIHCLGFRTSYLLLHGSNMKELSSEVVLDCFY